MATQRRSWLERVGVVLAITFGALVSVTTPAFAAASVISGGFNPNTINVNSESNFRFKLKESTPGANNIDNIQVSIVSGNSAQCTENCGSFDANLNQQGETDTLQVKFKGTAQGNTQVRITVGGQGVGNPYTLAVNQPQQQPEYTGNLQGVVNNITTGKVVAGARVTLQDGNQKSFTATTSNAGTYAFNGANLKIAPGLLVVTATKDPLVLVGDAKTLQVAAGQSATLPALEMQDAAAPTPSVAPAVVPSEDASASPGPTSGALDNASDEGGLDSMTWIMIIVGGVLVALGIGAIVLLLVRRNSDDDEEEDEDEQPARGRPGPRGGPQPGYRQPPQPTQQYGGGGYRPADPTMVARPGMNDAPTMMHRPDPYGGQQTQQYGGQGQQGWAPQQQPGYGAPASGPGYGQQASGGGGYGQQASGGGAYAGPASGGGGYGGQGNYGGGGYGQQPGYGAGQYDEPTSYAGGAAPGGGYDQAGYDQQQPGYGQGGGYGQTDQYGQQGYQQDPYGQQGYSDDRRNRGDRRLDWLDD